MGIKKNVIYTSILTTSNYIFPLVVYPYVARVLGVTNIGLCNFIDNIINYFILFSMMGINIMGNRQIASDKALGIPLSKSFSSLFTLNAITTAIAVVCLVIVTLTVPDIRDNKEMMWFGAIKLISNFMLIEWFYKGMEDFRYITLRTLLVKCLYVAAIFIFIQTEEDYPVYYLLTVLMVTVNALINMFHARKLARFKFKVISFKGIFKPFFMLGIYLVVTSFCTTFNVVFLGFVSNDTQVGYYSTAIKLYSIFLAFFTGVTSVLLPRMSSLISLGKEEEFRKYLATTSSLLINFSMPVILLTVIFAPQIVSLIAGPGYQGAVTPMRIVMPLMLIIGFEQILVIQGLMPLRADKKIMLNASAGAIVSIVLNILLTKNLMSIGSSISWISSEFTILVLSQIALQKLLKLRFPFRELGKSFLTYAPLAALLLIIYFFSNEEYYWIYLFLGIVVAAVYTLSLQIFILKNRFIINFISGLRGKLSV